MIEEPAAEISTEPAAAKIFEEREEAGVATEAEAAEAEDGPVATEA
jgi:hypothetical protein